MNKEIIEVVQEIMLPFVKEKSWELVDVEYIKEGSDWFLRVYLDKVGGIDLTECGIASEFLSEKLDELDPIKGNYFLEVSSPGAERPLRTIEDFQNHIDYNVYLTLYAPVDGAKEYEGLLVAFKDETALIEYKDKTRKKEVEIPFAKIAKARLSVML